MPTMVDKPRLVPFSFYKAINLTADLLLATLPIPMIWKVQVQMHYKVAIGFVMSLGALYVFLEDNTQLADYSYLELQLPVR